MKNNTWIKFTKDVPLKTGDILIIKKGASRELAFVDSSLTTDFPTTICSIPGNWSYGFLDGDCHFLFPNLKENDEDNSVVLGTTRLRNIDKEYCFTIEKYMRLSYEDD